MKKIIAIMFILLVGLFILSGCTSITTDTPPDQQQIPIPKPEQTSQAGADEKPQPPSLPEAEVNNQKQAGEAFPQPPALPEE